MYANTTQLKVLWCIQCCGEPSRGDVVLYFGEFRWEFLVNTEGINGVRLDTRNTGHKPRDAQVAVTPEQPLTTG